MSELVIFILWAGTYLAFWFMLFWAKERDIKLRFCRKVYMDELEAMNGLIDRIRLENEDLRNQLRAMRNEEPITQHTEAKATTH